MALNKPGTWLVAALLTAGAIGFVVSGGGSESDPPGATTAAGDPATAAAPSTDDTVWAALENAHWFAEGAEEPERTVYVFVDPQCPYCNLLWRASQPYLEQGLQVRNVVVAYLSPESTEQAAAILSANDPEAVHEHHQEAFRDGGLQAEAITEQGRRALAANNELLGALGVPATPAIYYRDEDGRVRRVIGLPEFGMLAEDVFRMPELPQTDPALVQYQ